MKINLKPFKLLPVSGLVELASSADANFEQCRKALDRLAKDLDSRRTAIANRWKAVDIAPADRARLATHETTAAFVEIRGNAGKELDGYLKRAHALMVQADEQRPLFESPVQVLERSALGEPARTQYLAQVRDAGPVTLAHLAQVAVGTGNVALAAAVLNVLDRMPRDERPFTANELALAMQMKDWDKAQEALRVVQNRGQATINAIRAFRTTQEYRTANIADAMRRAEERPHVLADDGDEG